jgi:hypothetical protein
MRRLTDFPVLMLASALIFGAISIWKESEAGLGFASGLTTAAGTAYQYRDNDAPD